MATNTKNTTAPDAETEPSEVAGIEKTVQENTPSFVSKYLNIVVDNLESFRVTTFNHQYIFYPILIIFVFFVLRFIWKRFF